MQFDINRDLLLKSLNFVQGVVEKKNTLPILSNVLLNLKNNKLEIVATDLDIVFYDEISELKIFTISLKRSWFFRFICCLKHLYLITPRFLYHQILLSMDLLLLDLHF